MAHNQIGKVHCEIYKIHFLALMSILRMGYSIHIGLGSFCLLIINLVNYVTNMLCKCTVIYVIHYFPKQNKKYVVLYYDNILEDFHPTAVM